MYKSVLPFMLELCFKIKVNDGLNITAGMKRFKYSTPETR